MQPADTFLTQDEAAKRLRLSPRTLERMRLNGDGPRFIKAGRRVLYRNSSLEAWVDDRTFVRTSEIGAGA